MDDRQVRAALERHWAAADANDFDAEHQIYRDDAVLEYPQSGERVRGRANIRASRVVQPSSKRFKVRRIISAADLWVTELLITYDARPSYSVSIMELKDGKVARETQYFCDPFEPGPSRARWVERIGWTRTGPPASFGASLLRPYNCRCLRRSSGWRVATRDEVSDEP